MDIHTGSQGPRSFDELVATAGSARNTISELRKFCLSLGSNVVEDVRAHRVVFGKSMAMRWFADLSADNGIITIKLNEGRRNDPSIIELKAGDDTRAARDAISAAYTRV